MQDFGPMAASTGFLSRLRVLDLSIWRPGPYATSLLVPLGADVLKVEPPGGDKFRSLQGYKVWQRGKRSVVLDLASDEGREDLLRLLADARFGREAAGRLRSGWECYRGLGSQRRKRYTGHRSGRHR